MSVSAQSSGVALARSIAVRFGFASLSLALLGAVGCGKAQEQRIQVFPVQGKVTFKGAPTVGAVVALHPKNAPADDKVKPHGNVAPDGTFSITTYDRADGAPEGEYVVTVLWYKPVKQGPDTLPGPNVIPNKYASPTTSDLVVKVAAGENNLEPIRL